MEEWAEVEEGRGSGGAEERRRRERRRMRTGVRELYTTLAVGRRIENEFPILA
jgi:hypothetical protein